MLAGLKLGEYVAPMMKFSPPQLALRLAVTHSEIGCGFWNR